MLGGKGGEREIREIKAIRWTREIRGIDSYRCRGSGKWIFVFHSQHGNCVNPHFTATSSGTGFRQFVAEKIFSPLHQTVPDNLDIPISRNDHIAVLTICLPLRIGELERRITLPFNGYGEEVANVAPIKVALIDPGATATVMRAPAAYLRALVTSSPTIWASSAATNNCTLISTLAGAGMPAGQVVTLRYRINEKLSLEASQGPLNQKAGINYRIEK